MDAENILLQAIAEYGAEAQTDNQKDWLDKLAKQGYATAVCYGWQAAKEVIEKYLKRKGSDKT